MQALLTIMVICICLKITCLQPQTSHNHTINFCEPLKYFVWISMTLSVVNSSWAMHWYLPCSNNKLEIFVACALFHGNICCMCIVSWGFRKSMKKEWLGNAHLFRRFCVQFRKHNVGSSGLRIKRCTKQGQPFEEENLFGEKKLIHTYMHILICFDLMTYYNDTCMPSSSSLLPSPPFTLTLTLLISQLYRSPPSGAWVKSLVPSRW